METRARNSNAMRPHNPKLLPSVPLPPAFTPDIPSHLCSIPGEHRCRAQRQAGSYDPCGAAAPDATPPHGHARHAQSTPPALRMHAGPTAPSLLADLQHAQQDAPAYAPAPAAAQEWLARAERLHKAQTAIADLVRSRRPSLSRVGHGSCRIGVSIPLQTTSETVELFCEAGLDGPTAAACQGAARWSLQQRVPVYMRSGLCARAYCFGARLAHQ